MYSPYLYGRQSELLALRAIVTSGGDIAQLVPVIEPVLRKSSGVVRCLKEYGEAGQRSIVDINPMQNEFADLASRQQLRKDLKGVFDSYETIIPGYRIHSSVTKKSVDEFFKMYSGRPVCLMLSSPALSDADLQAAATNANVAYTIVLDGRVTAAQLALLPADRLIDTRDHFEKQARNADYGSAELFTDRHKAIGASLLGIGDYTIVGRLLELGGGPPGAVTIHATYKNSKSGDVWVEHFVSDDTDRDVGDVASKFLQAATKLITQVKKRPKEFGAGEALDCYRKHVANDHSPGLGKNKELQIRHHVRLMLDVINGAL